MSRIPRIYIDRELAAGLDLRPDEQATRHLTRVLRLRAGARVRVFDGRGEEREATLLSGDGGPFLRLGTPVAPPPESALRICLVQGISRGERMDLVIQKATELGVAEIRPVTTGRSVVKLDRRRKQNRLDHWQGVVVAACEQCGRATLPMLHAPSSLEASFRELPDRSRRWMLDAGGSGPSVQARPEGSVVLLVGPEGGLTDEEKARATKEGFTPLRLGPRIMRTETAAIAAIAAFQAVWGDLGVSP